MDDDIFVMSIEQRLTTLPDETRQEYFVCIISFNDVHELKVTPLALGSDKTNNRNQLPAIKEFVDKQWSYEF